jgi:hypothetical protein
MRVIVPVAAIFLLLTISGCEVSTSATIHRGPTFSLDGSGRLVSFRVYGPQIGRKIATPNDEKSLVWSIKPITGDGGALVVRMEVVYGAVPRGYAQAVPVSGTAPVLRSGLVYYFFAETTGASGAEGFFYMDGASPVLINVPGLCESAFVGDVKPVKCGTNEPYIEPKDLEQFVKEQRVD